MHVPRLTERDGFRHMALVMLAGAVSVMTGGHLNSIMPMWAAWWIFECIRDVPGDCRPQGERSET